MTDLELMLRRIRGDTIYMYVQFGVDGKLYVEVIKTWCYRAKEKNGFHRHTHQVWRMLGFTHLHYTPSCPTDHLVCSPMTPAY